MQLEYGIILVQKVVQVELEQPLRVQNVVELWHTMPLITIKLPF
jgi:hypothetical protein